MKVKRHAPARRPSKEPSENAARAPSRRRGELRVAALLDAAGAAFFERGFEGATMTEIASRAGAAIGSLYQFFPSKESLAKALLERYGDRIERRLRDLTVRAASLKAEQLADALIDLRLDLRKERSAALALADSALSSGRAHLRETMRTQVKAALRAMNPSLDEARASASAAMILQLLKQVQPLLEADPRGSLGLVRELRTVLTLYIRQVLRRSDEPRP